MKCTDIQNILDDYIDETVSSDERSAVTSHLQQCASCRGELEQRRVIHSALGSLPVVEASTSFEANVFSAVRRRYGEGRRHAANNFVAGFASAAVAGLALWFASTLFTTGIDEYTRDQQAPQVVNLEVNQVRTVRLVFDAATDLAGVTLSVDLPQNIQLAGYGEQRQLVWQTDLNKGQNILALPVIATGNGEGELMAKLSYGDKTRQFHIVLKAADEGALIIQTINTISA